jgi:NAD dependent epimerase/dehydratase family enzyme
MSHLILTGATGLVGSAALAHILSLPAGKVAKLSILSRRPVPMAEGKPNVEVIIQKDFSTYEPEVLEKLKSADSCIWAQGVSVASVTKE